MTADTTELRKLAEEAIKNGDDWMAVVPQQYIALLDQNEARRKALEPFAMAAKNFDGYNIADDTQWFAYSGKNHSDGTTEGAISIRSLRNATKAIGES